MSRTKPIRGETSKSNSPKAAPGDDGQLAARIGTELELPLAAVAAVLRLTREGATVPFIARYRKEATGALDEVQIRRVCEHASYLEELTARCDAILDSVRNQGLLNADLERRLRSATTKAELEDLYLPFRPKRRTRASVARERGLAPLAEQMWNATAPRGEGQRWPERAAESFVALDRDVPDVATALAGARDICAERLAEHADLRHHFRNVVGTRGILKVTKTKAFKDKSTKFDAYADYREPLTRVASHRALAIARGEAEGVLKVQIETDADQLATVALDRLTRDRSSPWFAQLREVARDATHRLLLPAAQSAVRSGLDERAESAAIGVFATNLRQLLLAPPFGGKPVLAIDPGQRTGCKCVALDATGRPLEHDTVYLVSSSSKLEEAKRTLARLLKRHNPDAVAVGNGTHGRETERFVTEVIAGMRTPNPPCVVSVNEAGASVYSASEVARREFADLDVTIRGAISIGRRLQDPLAELVKVEPKSIGVGQYQHDVDQRRLGEQLSVVVESCVNEVGVELNTASAELLSYVAGVGTKVARSIVAHRNEHGAFSSRSALLKVAGLGPKTFEQCAGFLRIREAKNPLDASGVHPERYELVSRMAKDEGATIEQLIGNRALLQRLDVDQYADVGRFTLQDILAELEKPGRDPRSHFERPTFDDALRELSDLKPGMQLEGLVTNVTAFGAFVDVGVHQDGLVHISELADRFVKDPMTVVRVGERVRVRVLQVDQARNRISLSRKGLADT